VRRCLFLVPVISACLLSSCATVPFREADRDRSGAPRRREADIPKTARAEADRPANGRPELSEQLAGRKQIVEYAESLIGRRDLAKINGWFRNDCSGFVIGVYRTLGYSVRFPPRPPSRQVSLLLHHILYRERLTYSAPPPNIADVVFFSGTVDPGLNKVSHVGIVSSIGDDGTVRVLNYTSRGVTVLNMNLDRPSVHVDEKGAVQNDFLRKRLSAADNGKLLSGELFLCFGDLLTYCQL
jgi:hypothetical protein